jgi:SH3 domain-containing YSC84-like protein 1
VSIAAGPVGRNAEAAGAASLKGVAGVFAYSKTKGLFAGVSLEGSVLIERRDANEKMYNRRVTARALLEGAVPVPREADPLMAILNSRIFSGVAASAAGDAMYNDIPVYDDAHEDVVWQGGRGQAMGENQRSSQLPTSPRSPTGNGFGAQRASTWQDDVYDRADVAGVSRSSTFADGSQGRGRSGTGFDSNYSFSDKPKPARPSAPKPAFGAKRASMTANQAIAKFTFDGEQAGDLSFKKGEIITILKRTENESDWWTGRIGEREGIFPRYVLKPQLQLMIVLELTMHCSNYVETV